MSSFPFMANANYDRSKVRKDWIPEGYQNAPITVDDLEFAGSTTDPSTGTTSDTSTGSTSNQAVGAPISYSAANYTAPDMATQTFGNPVLGSTDAISGNALVANQFNNLIADDSPLMQMARTSALQGMNQRGTMNSSMTQTAADLAAYQAALPIAQQDASTYATSDLAAQNAYNQGGLVQQAANYDAQNMLNQGAIEGALQNQLAQDSLTMEQLEHANNMEIASAQYDQVVTSSLAAAMASLLGDPDITDMIGAQESLMSAIQTGLEW